MLVGILAVLMPFVLKFLSTGTADFPFYVMAVLTGLVIGAQFPLANRMFRASDSVGVGRSAGLLEWADHLGGMAGAVMVGVFIVPLFGISGACAAVAAVKLISIAALAVMLARR